MNASEHVSRANLVTSEQFLALVGTGEWAVGDFRSRSTPRKIIFTSASKIGVHIELEAHPGMTKLVMIRALEGEISIEATASCIRIFQRGVRREQIKKSEGGGWRQIAHDFVRVRLVHLPTWEASDQARRERDVREQAEQVEKQRRVAKAREERAELARIEAQARIVRYLASLKESVSGARITDLVLVENGLRLEFEDGRALIATLEERYVPDGVAIANGYEDGLYVKIE